MADTENYDLVVLGCGPAGLTLAWKAAGRGLSVLAIDKKKSPGDVSFGWLAKKVALRLPLLPLLFAKMALSGKARA